MIQQRLQPSFLEHGSHIICSCHIPSKYQRAPLAPC